MPVAVLNWPLGSIDAGFAVRFLEAPCRASDRELPLPFRPRSEGLLSFYVKGDLDCPLSTRNFLLL